MWIKRKHFLFWLLCIIQMFFSSAVFAQLKADFKSNITSGCSPIVVVFTDLSTGSPSSWDWDFGNGNTSVLKNPTASYTTPGKYTVTLKVSDGSKNDTKIVTNYITVFQNPVAAISVTPVTSGCVPLSVKFNDQSQQGGGVLNKWIWDFGDGNTSNLQNPTYTYSTPGVYSISLNVTDLNGCTDTKVLTNYIKVNAKPTVSFSTSIQKVCKTPAVITFTNSSSGTGSLNYLWDFGDTSSSTAKDINHSYKYPGIYSVKLVVTDPIGCKDSLTKTSLIIVENVRAFFDPGKDTFCALDFIKMNNKSSGNTTNYWTFGDGNTTSVPDPSYLYLNTGTYKVKLRVSNGLDCADSFERTLTIETVTANFKFDSSYSCKAPMNVKFTDLSSNAFSWYWDFGDATTSNLKNPTHKYTHPGQFYPVLTITGKSGCKASFASPNPIEIIPPYADFTADFQKGCAPLHSKLTDLSNAGEPIVKWEWDFDDGDTSSLQNPTHTFVNPGKYFVKLKITNKSGCTGEMIQLFSVGVKPIINFNVRPPLSCAIDTVYFIDSSYNSLGDSNDEWHWEFGDKMTGSGDSTFHIHVDTGWMYVQLVVGYNGCYDTLKRDSMIYIKAPVSIITPKTDCSKPLDFSFLHTHKGAQYWEIDFGDGNKMKNLTVDSVFHRYLNSGVYAVKAVAYNDSTGCKWPSFLTVNAHDVNADFNTSTQRICAGDSFEFKNKSTYGTIQYWDFGDGNTSRNIDPGHLYQKPGFYKVKFVVSEFGGCSDSTEMIIKVYSAKADFSCDTFSCAPGKINFIDKSVSDTTIANREWQFGDGFNSNIKNPSHVYSAEGYYSPMLVIENFAGCIDTLYLKDYIRLQKPKADFNTGDRYLCYNDSAKFVNPSSGKSLSYFWSFGDGNTSILKTPSHFYTSPGTYAVSLIVTDSKGCKDTAFKPAYIEVQKKIVAQFTADTIYANCYPLLVRFTDLTNSTDIINWDWNFGDSTANSSFQNPAHSYTLPGIYDVTLTVITSFSCSDTIVKHQFVEVKGPTADFDLMPDTLCTFDKVLFYLTKRKNVFSYDWDFGNGNVIPGIQDTVTYRYTTGGIYFPRIIYIDSTNTCRKSAEDTIFVSFVTASYIPSDTSINAPSLISFNNTSSANSNYWKWDFGDQSDTLAKNTDHYYNKAGYYPVKLIAKNAEGCLDTFIQIIHIKPLEPIIDVPSAFTPNGDGKNDIIKVEGAGIRFDKLLGFSIYNRFGELIFETKNVETGWDGYYKGKLQNIETYVYLVTVVTLEGDVITQKGYISLLK